MFELMVDILKLLTKGYRKMFRWLGYLSLGSFAGRVAFTVVYWVNLFLIIKSFVLFGPDTCSLFTDKILPAIGTVLYFAWGIFSLFLSLIFP